MAFLNENLVNETSEINFFIYLLIASTYGYCNIDIIIL